MSKQLILLGLLIFLARCQTGISGEKPLVDMQTVEEIWAAQPDQVRNLIDAVNPTTTGIEEYLEKKDTLGATRKLLQYFRSVERDWVITTLDSMPDAQIVADRLLRDSLQLAGQLAKIPSATTGGWQWNYTGVNPDDEFGYSLNGHKYLPSLYFAQIKKPNGALIKKFDQIIIDWVLNHPLPSPNDSIYIVLDSTKSIDWRDIGEVEWRTLETGNRLGASWAALFFAFQQATEFSDAARVVMLSSIVDQAKYLQQYHKSRHNWTTMEMNGLALVGLAFPEFRLAEEWSSYALRVMDQEINRQVYPDGVQTEISTKTQWVALNRFESVATNFAKAGKPVSSPYIQRVELMYHYLAYSIRPDGHQPLNNDSDREDLRPRVLKAAQKFNRPDWIWIATNGGQGALPQEGPSLIFPWGGMQIMRNSWSQDAHWAFFDIGPYGTGHQHRDKLHLSVTAFGKDFLVDGGRYTHQDYFSFDPANWRGYFRSSNSHNVILLDGKGQKEGALRASEPLREGIDYCLKESYDFASGIFEEGFEDLAGHASHRRSVLYVKNNFWLVIDHIDSDRPHKLEVLWHFHPDHQVVLDQSVTQTENQNGPNLKIVPAGNVTWSAEIIQGREAPTIQGWYSADYGKKVPNPTAIYSSQISEPVTFAWLVIPAKDVLPEASINLVELPTSVRLQIQIENEKSITIDVPNTGRADGVKIL